LRKTMGEIPEMKNSWLCITSLRNLSIMKRTEVYGVSSRDKRRMETFREGDDLFLYVPTIGIAAYCRIISRLLECRNEDKKYPYPYLVRIRFLWDAAGDTAKAIPFLPNPRTDISLEPIFTIRAVYSIPDWQRDYYLSKLALSRVNEDQ